MLKGYIPEFELNKEEFKITIATLNEGLWVLKVDKMVPHSSIRDRTKIRNYLFDVENLKILEHLKRFDGY